MKKHAWIGACLALLTVLPATAQFAKPENAVRYRQSVMYAMGNNLYSRIGAMANGRMPFDARAAARAAEAVAFLSQMPWDAFIPGTDKVGDTDAKPAIWTEQAKFKDLSEKMQAETAKLVTVAKTGDLEALKGAFRATANSCKACHDTYTSQ